MGGGFAGLQFGEALPLPLGISATQPLPLGVCAAGSVSRAPNPAPSAPHVHAGYKEYLSIFHWLNADRTQEYSYDLKPLCGVDRALAVPIPNVVPVRYWWFFWAIAGNVSRNTFSCNPS